jgi:hypothetical protein
MAAPAPTARFFSMFSYKRWGVNREETVNGQIKAQTAIDRPGGFA